jgi:hypothetical protein
LATDGSLATRVFGLVSEWAEKHREELFDNWKSLAESGDLKKIEPLV